MCKCRKQCIWPEECARSQERERAGQVFREATSFTSGPNIIYQPKQPALKNVLAQNVTHRTFSTQPCAICHDNNLTHRPALFMANNRLEIGLAGSMPSYHVNACGHTYHPACLFSLILETSDLMVVPCNACENLRTSMRTHPGCSVHAVEYAMEQLTVFSR